MEGIGEGRLGSWHSANGHADQQLMKSSESAQNFKMSPATNSSQSVVPMEDTRSDAKQLSPLKKFFCPCCNVGHATSEELINHVREFPIKRDTFICNLCMLEFFVKSDLIDHQRKDHQVMTHKTFKCDECDLEYTNLSQLSRHKKMHEEISKKLAACGIFLPKPKKSEPPSSDKNTAGSVFPNHCPQTSSSSAEKDLSPVTAESGNMHSTADNTTVKEEGEPPLEEETNEKTDVKNDSCLTNPARKQKPATRASTRLNGDHTRSKSAKTQLKEKLLPGEKSQPKEKAQPKEKFQSKENSQSREKPQSIKDQFKESKSQSKVDSSTGFFNDVYSRECDADIEDSVDVRKSGDNSDKDWQDYCVSDFTSDAEDGVDDPEFFQVRRGRGRPKGSKNKTVSKVQRRGAKRKGSAMAKVAAEEDRPRKKSERIVERRAKGNNLEREEWAQRQRNNMPAAKKTAKDEEEDMDVPSPLLNKDGSIQCPDCEVICYSLRGLNRHRKYHFRTMQVVKCVLCDHEFTDKESMNTHMSQQHRLRQNRTSKTLSGSQEFRCMEGDCGQVFVTGVALSKHRIRDHGIDKSQLHKCDQCGKVYPGSTELKNHKRMHTDERPFRCSLCSKAYRSSGGLLWHLKTHSEKSHDILNKYKGIKVTEEGNYACELCDKEFKSVYGIRIHKENPQKKCSATPGYWGKWKPKPAMCEVCGREFPSKVTLKSHMVTHTGERPHKCKYCEATFKHYKNKFIHEKVHRNQKDFVCNVCGKAFYDGTNLKTHIDSHKDVRDLPCQLCGKLFHVEINRRRHEKRCRNFIRCPVCAAVFRQQERLMRHMMISHHSVVAQKPDSDWLSAQPMSNTECSVGSTEPATVKKMFKVVGNSCISSTNFVDSFSMFVDSQPQQQPQVSTMAASLQCRRDEL